jgi:hypothetical protein
MSLSPITRLHFFQVAAGSIERSPAAQEADNPRNLLGPIPGYSPQVDGVGNGVDVRCGAGLGQGLTTAQLDFVLESKAGMAWARLLYLAATERLYQLLTF